MTKLFQTILFLFAIFVVGLSLDFYRFVTSPLVLNDGAYYDYIFETGETALALAHDLKRAGLLTRSRDVHYFVFLAKWNNQVRYLKAGEYRVSAGQSAPELLDQITKGKVLYHTITLINGWTFEQMMTEIRENPYLNHQIKPNTIEAVAKQINLPVTNPEGLLFPETYYFTRNYTDAELIRWAFNTMDEILKKEWKNRAAALPYRDAYQALIAASLIEKETKLDSEREKISGVLARRLKLRMRLQFDPTVIYALGDKYDGSLSKSDLRVDSPYNTYRHYGLPPTPIAMPSLPSIHAAMHPDDSGTLYFVATGNGGHVFSKTLSEHNKAVAQYIHSRQKEEQSVLE